MSALTLSPGPWRMRESLKSFEWFVIEDVNGKRIASVRGDKETDGHAMTATPDLYAVVQKVAEHFAGTDAPLGEMARAALTRAAGEGAKP